jgi:DNA polymerase III alpha subunit
MNTTDFNSKFNNYEISNFGLVRLPQVHIDNKYKIELGLTEKSSNFELLKALSYKGYEGKKARFNKEKFDKYKKQLDFELDLVEELSFTDYFLLVWMIINKVKEMDAFCDFGRGSCAASLIFYLLGVTGVDPIDKELIFSRFISKVRAKKQIINGNIYLQGDLAPDVDLNLGGIREEIIKWLKELYPGRISKIINLNTFTGKILIKDTYKTLENASEDEAKEISDLIEKHAGFVEDIEKMPEKNEYFQKWVNDHKETFETALKLRNVIHQRSSHASGYFISFDELYGNVPIELNKEKDIAVGFDMEQAANFAIKLDLLGLVSNEIINEIVKNIPEKIEDINLDNNPIIYDQFQNGKLLPYGLYQISADCAYRVLNGVKPKNIYELSDVNAIARPGALDYLDGYIENLSDCPHPLFEKVLKPTRNYCLYQEQMMQMGIAIGFTPEESELLRRVVGKKKVDEVKLWKERIYTKIKENKLPENIGDIFWKILEDSSKYSFNLSHSLATSYLTALTVYLKYKYPLQFYTACLKSAGKLPNTLEAIREIANELKYFGIKLLPPNLLKSEIDFTIEENNIRFGLMYIKGVSDKTIEKINKFKTKHSNKFDIFNAAKESKVSIGVLSAMIQAGALDDLPDNRTRIVAEAQLWNLLKEKEKIAAMDLGKKYNYDLFEVMKELKMAKNDDNKAIIKESRYETIKRNFDPYYKIYLQNKKNNKYANYFYENSLLGYSYSTNLKDAFIEYLPDLIDIKEVVDSPHRKNVLFVATILRVVNGTAKNANKTRYLKMQLSDETANITGLMFGKDRIDESKLREKKLPEEGDVIICRGLKNNDVVYVNEFGIQNNKIFMRLVDVEKLNPKKENE